MLFVRFSLFILIAFEYNFCLGNVEKNFDQNVSTLSRQQRHYNGIYSRLRSSATRCPNRKKSCKAFFIYKRALMKEKRKCCRARHSLCENKLLQICTAPDCFKLQAKKCERQLRRCKRRRITTTRFFKQCDLAKIFRKHGLINRNQRKITSSNLPSKKKVREICSENSECETGLCCARHNHVRICKPLIVEGQVCTKTFFTRKRSPEMYERCPCAKNLTCAPSQSRHNTCQKTT